MKVITAKHFTSAPLSHTFAAEELAPVSAGTVPAQRIRVLRIARASLTPALRGRERAIASRFPQVDLKVISAKAWKETGVDVEVRPDELFEVEGARTFFSKHIQAFAYDPRPIVSALRRHRPHIIDLDHEPYSVPAAEIIWLRDRFSPGTRIVMQTAQNILKKYPFPFSFMERRAFEAVDGAYMCSDTVREVLEAKGFDKPLTLAPFGVDTEMFRPRPQRLRDGMPFTVGYVGRLLPEKGLTTLTDALGRLKHENWRLMVVGDGPERESVEARLRELGILDRATFAGAVPYEHTPRYFHWMDALVIPTLTTGRIREQFGRVIVEAMACGIPVIGSTCGAIPEVIGDAGMIFPEGDAEALAEAIERLLKDELLGRRLAAYGFERVRENFTWAHAAERIFGLYLRVLGLAPEGGAE